MHSRNPRRDARILIVVHGVLYTAALMSQSLAAWRGWAGGLFIASSLAIGFSIPGPARPRTSTQRLLAALVAILYLGIPILLLSGVGRPEDQPVPIILTALACVPAWLMCAAMWRAVGRADHEGLRQALGETHWHPPFRS